MTGYKLNTLPTSDGKITQTLEWVGPDYIGLSIDSVSKFIWRKVLDTSDEHVRLALIQLGWTPPRA